VVHDGLALEATHLQGRVLGQFLSEVLRLLQDALGPGQPLDGF
jgi:hypothetical protein